jgi:hypothetical protein
VDATGSYASAFYVLAVVVAALGVLAAVVTLPRAAGAFEGSAPA